MKYIDAPTKTDIIWASGPGAGAVTVIPDAASPTPGGSSFTTGFTSVNMEPISAGGIPPFGADFNGIFQRLTKSTQWKDAGGTYTFDAAFAAEIGGYPKGAVVASSDSQGLWISNIDDNLTDPSVDPTNWTVIQGGDFMTLGFTSPGVPAGTLVSSSGGVAVVAYATPITGDTTKATYPAIGFLKAAVPAGPISNVRVYTSGRIVIPGANFPVGQYLYLGQNGQMVPLSSVVSSSNTIFQSVGFAVSANTVEFIPSIPAVWS